MFGKKDTQWPTLGVSPATSIVLGISSSRKVRAGETGHHQQPIGQLSYLLAEAGEIWCRNVHTVHTYSVYTPYTYTPVIHITCNPHTIYTLDIYTTYVPSMHPLLIYVYNTIYTIGKHIHMYSMHTVYNIYTNNTCIRYITYKTYMYYSYHIIYTHYNI